MIVPTYLLTALAVLGAADILLFHTIAQDIRRHPPARAELVTHFLRGPVYCALFLVVPNLTLDGAAMAGLLALLAVDLGISIADFSLEPASRRALGGLPRGEYLLHVGIAMLFGALVASVLYEDGWRLGRETAVTWRPDGAPALLRIALAVSAPIALGTAVADLVAVFRLGRAEA